MFLNTIFWDMHGIIHIDYLEKGKKINAQYYREFLDRFDTAIKAKRSHLARKKTSSIKKIYWKTKQLKR